MPDTFEQFKQILGQKQKVLYRSMPWRDNHTPYYVLVSEFMLQQTQVTRVVPKFNEFVRLFPTIESLAEALLSDVLTVWSGLGYNRRARYLHDAAKYVMSDCNGIIPENIARLLCLPGVGKATAGAIAVYAFNQPELFIETNIRTVLLHHFFKGQHSVKDSQLLHILERVVDAKHPRLFYWAMMDYGTSLKQSGVSLLTQSSHYKKQTPLKGSVRETRGIILSELVKHTALHLDRLQNNVGQTDRFETAFSGLLKEKLVTVDNMNVVSLHN
jgi:A/G-specific adenine glycosylase